MGRAVAGLAAAFAAAAWPALLAGPATAAFTVAPSVRDLPLDPGEARVDTFRVKTRNERGRFVIEKQDVLQRPDGGLAYARPGGSRFSASSWITVHPRWFPGAPDRVQPVEYRVRVPRDAEPGDHVASLTLKRLKPPDARGVTTIQAISVRLTIRVAGRRREGVAIERLDVPAVAGRGPVMTRALLRNTGNVRLEFDGANRASLALLAGSHERVSLPVRGVLWPAQAREVTLRLEGPPLAGRLTARATVKLRAGVVTRAASIWMVPWRQAAALALLAVAALVIARGRQRRRRAASNAVG